MPQQPERAEDHRPDMKAVAHEDELVRRTKVRPTGEGSMNCVHRHPDAPFLENSVITAGSYVGRETELSAAERALGGGHFARRPRIDGDSRPQRPRQTLEAGFGDMVAVLPI